MNLGEIDLTKTGSYFEYSFPLGGCCAVLACSTVKEQYLQQWHFFLFVCLFQGLAVKLFSNCPQLKSVKQLGTFFAAPWKRKAPSARITAGAMAVTKILQAWNSITVRALPCTQSGFSLNNYAAPKASHFLSWGCVDVDLPQVLNSPFIIPSFYPAGVKKKCKYTSFSAYIHNLYAVSRSLCLFVCLCISDCMRLFPESKMQLLSRLQH